MASPPRRAFGAAACAIGLAIFAAPRAASAEKFQLVGFHAAYAIGGAPVGDPTLRQALDVGVAAGWNESIGSHDGFWNRNEATTIGAFGLFGFGKYPTYAGVEVGHASDTTLAGVCWAAGPVVRVEPFSAWGLGARLAGTLLGFQAGGRVLVAYGVGGADAQLLFTVGFGAH